MVSTVWPLLPPRLLLLSSCLLLQSYGLPASHSPLLGPLILLILLFRMIFPRSVTSFRPWFTYLGEVYPDHLFKITILPSNALFFLFCLIFLQSSYLQLINKENIACCFSFYLSMRFVLCPQVQFVSEPRIVLGTQ